MQSHKQTGENVPKCESSQDDSPQESAKKKNLLITCIYEYILEERIYFSTF